VDDQTSIGAWLYTVNDKCYPAFAGRGQAAVRTVQGHVSYVFRGGSGVNNERVGISWSVSVTAQAVAEDRLQHRHVDEPRRGHRHVQLLVGLGPLLDPRFQPDTSNFRLPGRTPGSLWPVV
jgi:hypothetical protein